MRVEPTGQNAKALPCRLNVLDSIAEINVGQRSAMFIRTSFVDRLSNAAAIVFRSMNEPRRTGLWTFFFRSPFELRCFRLAIAHTPTLTNGKGNCEVTARLYIVVVGADKKPQAAGTELLSAAPTASA